MKIDELRVRLAEEPEDAWWAHSEPDAEGLVYLGCQEGGPIADNMPERYARLIIALRETAPALLAVVEAAGRMVDEPRFCTGDGGRPPCGLCNRCLLRATLTALEGDA